MSTLYLTINTTPGSHLLPNRRRKAVHWKPQYDETLRCRGFAKADTMNALNSSLGRTAAAAEWEEIRRNALAVHGLELHLTVVWELSREIPDLDAIPTACKGIVDGIADGLGIDDSLFTRLTVEQYRMNKPGDGCVRAVIRPNWSRATGEGIE